MKMLKPAFFNRDACTVAKALLGKIIRHKYQQHWLAARIIETESYYLEEKGSHASLGYTEKRKALFMPPGTIYMYYARGHDSLNFSTKGKGNAVLIKSAHYFQDDFCDPDSLSIMQSLNPLPSGELRMPDKLCSGQTLLCKALNLKVIEWDQKPCDPSEFFIEGTGYEPEKIIRTTRLGIPPGRDADLPNRFIDYEYTNFCSSNPIKKRNAKVNRDYRIISC